MIESSDHECHRLSVERDAVFRVGLQRTDRAAIFPPLTAPSASGRWLSRFSPGPDDAADDAADAADADVKAPPLRPMPGSTRPGQPCSAFPGARQSTLRRGLGKPYHRKYRSIMKIMLTDASAAARLAHARLFVTPEQCAPLFQGAYSDECSLLDGTRYLGATAPSSQPGFEPD